jgi:hypothetical protein
MPRYFTLEEATATLKMIPPILEEMMSLRQAILDRREEVWPVIQRAVGNGGSRTASKLAIEFSRMDALVHEIQDSGVILKDLNIGLLDFPHLKNGREGIISIFWGRKFPKFESRAFSCSTQTSEISPGFLKGYGGKCIFAGN